MIYRVVLILSLLLPVHFQPPGIDIIDLPYRIALPFIANQTQPHRAYFPQVSNGKATCQLLRQSPPDGHVFLPGADFDTSWIIQNTGLETWQARTVDILFTSGSELHVGPPVVDVPYDVTPGKMLDIVIGMKAPAAAGSYAANWAMMEGSRALCQFHIEIQVVVSPVQSPDR